MTSTRYILSDIKGFNEIVKCDVNNLEILKLNKIESRINKVYFPGIKIAPSFT